MLMCSSLPGIDFHSLRTINYLLLIIIYLFTKLSPCIKKNKHGTGIGKIELPTQERPKHNTDVFGNTITIEKCKKINNIFSV